MRYTLSDFQTFRMLYPLSILSLFLLFLIHLTSASHQNHNHNQHQNILTPNTDSIPDKSRQFWMQQANLALSQLSSPCPFAAFGTVIVNHSAITPDSPHGTLVCQGVNRNSETGNPTLHGMNYTYPRGIPIYPPTSALYEKA